MSSDFPLRLPGLLSRDALLAKLREREDLFTRLVDLSTDPETGENIFGFNSALDEREPDAPDFLKLVSFEDALDDQRRSTVKAAFIDFAAGKLLPMGLSRSKVKTLASLSIEGMIPNFRNHTRPRPDHQSPPRYPTTRCERLTWEERLPESRWIRRLP